jgi:uncharacterized membrane protein (UPF0127 family)
LVSCRNDAISQKHPSSIEDIRELKIENSKKISLDIKLAIGPYETSLGLSGVLPDQFKETNGLFFFFFSDEDRTFWMADTFFNLDIIFLDENLKVLHIEKNIPAHPGRSEKPPIPRTPIIKCRYVLEIKANAPFGKGLNVGDTLLLKSNYSLAKIREFILKNYY